MKFTLIEIPDIKYAQLQVITNIVQNGKQVGVRGMRYREIINVLLEFSPRCSALKYVHRVDAIRNKVFPELELLVGKFKNDRNTRRAYFLFPELDEGEPPCNVLYHFMIRDYKMILNVYLRSSDVINKFNSDIATAIWCLNRLSHAMNVERGDITFIIASAHALEEDLVADGYV